jgi:hypothetical protein
MMTGAMAGIGEAAAHIRACAGTTCCERNSAAEGVPRLLFMSELPDRERRDAKGAEALTP